MEFIMINHQELSALNGLPLLQQVLYMRGLKPFVDYKTGIIGLRRGVSYQSLIEALYVEPHSGIKSGGPSKDQVRRALKGLEKAGLLTIQSLERKLVFRCLLLTSDKAVQNQLAIKPLDETTTNPDQQTPAISRHTAPINQKHNPSKSREPAIPLDNNKYYLCVYRPAFEKFWDLYPKKNAKQKAWEAFQALQPTESLVTKILDALQQQISVTETLQSQGQWIPKWKFPANWLAQHCWEDEIDTQPTQEIPHATHSTRPTTYHAVDHFWESCKAGAEPITQA